MFCCPSGAAVAESWVRVNWMRDRLHSCGLANGAVVLMLLDCCREFVGSAPHEPALLVGEGYVRLCGVLPCFYCDMIFRMMFVLTWQTEVRGIPSLQ